MKTAGFVKCLVSLKARRWQTQVIQLLNQSELYKSQNFQRHLKKLLAFISGGRFYRKSSPDFTVKGVNPGKEIECTVFMLNLDLKEKSG